MAAMMGKGALKILKILTCALFVNLIRSSSAEHSSALSQLYKKIAEKNRPVFLVLDSQGLNRDRDNDKAVSREINYQKKYPYEDLQKLLDGQLYSKYRKPQYYNNKDDNDRRDRYRKDKDRLNYRPDDREYRSFDNRDDQNQYSRYRNRKDQQYERKDRYRSSNREDRKYRNRYYKEQSRLRTKNQEQVQDRNRQRMEGTARAQIPIVQSLLRSLRCSAKDECEETCDNDNSCEDECAQDYECDDDPCETC